MKPGIINNFEIKNICCIGAGYVGGPTMSVIADKCPDIMVTVVDINTEKIICWNEEDLKKLPIYEPNLEDVISRVRNRNLFFSTDIENSIKKADLIFISVNTPIKEKGIGSGKASNLKWVESSARQISSYAEGHTIVVEKSTLPVRTAEVIQLILNSSQNQTNPDHENKSFDVLSNPEFLVPTLCLLNFPSGNLVLASFKRLLMTSIPKNLFLELLL